MGVSLLIIDPQNDFHSGGTLTVAGADDDSNRIANFIRDNGAFIDNIIITLDSHAVGHIAQTSVWEDSNGNEPNVFTIITYEDIKNGLWRPKNKLLTDKYLDYTKILEEKGKFKLTIWPNHCIMGTKGHEIVDVLKEAVESWENSQRKRALLILKGQNCDTEMYSVFAAEVPLEDGPNTQFNYLLLKQLQEQTKVLICGQALSHCVNYSTRDLVSHWGPRDTKDLYIISDGSSSVGGYELDGEKFLQEMSQEGVQITTFRAMEEEIQVAASLSTNP